MKVFHPRMNSDGPSFEKWGAKEISDTRANPAEFLGYALNPRLLLALTQAYGTGVEQEIRDAASTITDRRLQYRTGVFFVRNYAIWTALLLFLKARNFRGFKDLVLPKLIFSVWIGMLAICGSSPWDFLGKLHDGSKYAFIGTCITFSVIMRAFTVARRPVPSTLSAINRGLFITGWGWFFGLALFLAFTGIYQWVDDGKGSGVRDAYWALLPSLGSAVGVIVQEIWEEKPLSEPL